MYYSTLIIEQNFILNSAFLKTILEILNESNAVAECCTSFLSHFVYSRQEPRQNAACQSCTGKGMLFSAQGFISCSQWEDAELSLSTPEESGIEMNLLKLGLKGAEPGFYDTRCKCFFWQFFPPTFPLCMFLFYFGIDPAALLRHAPTSPHNVR